MGDRSSEGVLVIAGGRTIRLRSAEALAHITRAISAERAAAQPRFADAHVARALTALAEDEALVRAFGPTVVDWLTRVKRSEVDRHDQAEDKDAWQAREYFSRF